MHLQVPPRRLRWLGHPGLLGGRARCAGLRARRRRRPHRGDGVRRGRVVSHHASRRAWRELRRGARPVRAVRARAVHAAVPAGRLAGLRHVRGAPLLLRRRRRTVRDLRWRTVRAGRRRAERARRRRSTGVRLLQVWRQALHGALVVPVVRLSLLLLLLLLLLARLLLLRLLLARLLLLLLLLARLLLLVLQLLLLVL